jgi:N-methylhydantoinase A
LTQQGHDPRDFSLYGFGGAGGLHAAAIARELGVRSVVVPMSNLAAGWSAFGISASDALVTEQAAVGFGSPFDPEELNRRWPVLEARVAEKLAQQGVPADAIEFRRYAELRYALQINQVAVPAEDGVYDAASVERLVATFEREYERLYGKGSGYAAAGFTLTGLQVHGTAKLSELRVGDLVHQGVSDAHDSVKGRREISWYGRGGVAEMTPVYDGARLDAGFTAAGPAIIEYPDTTVVVPHGCTAEIDPTGSVVIELHADA